MRTSPVGTSDHAAKRAAKPSYKDARVRRWSAYLWREAILKSRAPVAPVFRRPEPARWRNDELTLAWLGHSTVLINFFGVTVLTDPVLFPKIGVRIPFLFTLGPKRLTEPALTVRELPPIDILLLSHAHFDHFDRRTLRRFGRRTKVVLPPRTRDLLRWTRLCDAIEVGWGESAVIQADAGSTRVTGVRVKHWGARLQTDNYRGYTGYLIERENRRILFAGDTAFTESFKEVGASGVVDVAIMSIGAYNPWIQSHCNPEQAVQMANDARARFIVPVHHQTFRLSFEPMREPIDRFVSALNNQPERIALREIGETFVLPD